jgi:hypothetical protein
MIRDDSGGVIRQGNLGRKISRSYLRNIAAERNRRVIYDSQE